MKKIQVLLLGGVLVALSASHLPADQPLLFDGFENYASGTNSGVQVLDANFPGPNSETNGGPKNAWWGQFPPELRVARAETLVQTLGATILASNTVSPHGGTNMVRGAGGGSADTDVDIFNLAFRLNHPNGFPGNVMLDWWFYDTVGNNVTNQIAAQYQDHVALGFFDNIPTNSDYSTNTGPDPGTPLELLSLGAADSTGDGYSLTNYQAQIQGTADTNAYDQLNGWFNLPAVRSVGWHHARIVVSPSLADGTANAAFYIDDMVNAQLTNNTAATNGFNCIVMSANLGNVTGYFDDLTFDVIPPPSINITNVGTNAIVTWAVTGWTLQTSTNLDGTNFVDVPSAVSPYTNAITDAARYFRLRQ